MKLINICAIIAFSGLLTTISSANDDLLKSFLPGFNTEVNAAARSKYDMLKADEKEKACKPIVSFDEIKQCGIFNVKDNKPAFGEPVIWYCCLGGRTIK